MGKELIHEELSGQIIGAAMEVLNGIRPGQDEKPYENALAVELQSRGHVVEQQKEFPIYYKGNLVGKSFPDLIVDGLVIVDPKVVRAFDENHEAQMLGYLAITDLRLALLINFKYAELQWKRIVR